MLIENKSEKKQEVHCHISNKILTTLVLFLISAAFVSSGCYLAFYGTGTIPAQVAGWSFLSIGVSVILYQVLSFQLN